MRLLLPLVLVGLFLSGCASQRPAKSAYTVDANGQVSASTRSALEGDTGPGKQELVGLYLPVPPFAIKAGLEWDGTTFVFGGGAPQAAQVQAAPCAPQTVEVEESYTEMVPVQRVRKVQRQVVPIPVPQKQAAPCAPPAPAPQRAPCSQTFSLIEKPAMCCGPDGCGVSPPASEVPPDLQAAK